MQGLSLFRKHLIQKNVYQNNSALIMTSAQKAARRKKRVSKHVLMAKEEREKNNATLSAMENPIATAPKARKSSKKKTKVKDPSEAAAYLSAWKHKDAGGAWKFNTNTQSWLLRHMYEPENVSKATFSLLMEYLGGLQGKTRMRTVADARNRAVRYKEYERLRDADSGESKTHDTDGNEKEASGQDKDDSGSNEKIDEDDDARWKRLSDHDKRKEYKRARKILDTL